ncbi:signal peptidase I [Sporosarcina jiandibaonis]|uniref:signal peptidase I n=1 Tax=Sporosarcina jiandibaonis TaxID=2715535 RepID=UPI0015572A5C|nr:signal peptidase I [Sporosarcina jiandibaonis]
MKLFTRILNILLAIAILCTLIAAVGSAITKEPVLLTVIRSNSMSPVWERGDMVIVKNLKEKDIVHNRDIIFFETKKGSLAEKGWIAHRVVDGNVDTGFITQGDANKTTDQQDGSGPIEREWIAGRALTIGEKPIVIPKIGYLSLWMEEYLSNSYLLPVFALILAVLIGFGELKSGQKQKTRKSKGIELQLIYVMGGLTIAIIMGATMLASGQTLNLIYEISAQGRGVLMGSDVGILQVGDEVTQPLSELENGAFIPLIGSITTNDKQIVPSHKNIYLSQGQQLETNFTVTARKPGMYESTIQVGLFYPFLPATFIYFLSEKSYWLALIVVSFVPGLPLIIYPMIDGKMRRGIMKFIRKKKRKLLSNLP